MFIQFSGVDYVVDKCEFCYFMFKEIYEQLEIVEFWVMCYLFQGLLLEQLVVLLMDDVFYVGIEQVQILVCGISCYVVMVGVYLLEQFVGIFILVYYVSEFCYVLLLLVFYIFMIGVIQFGEMVDILVVLVMEVEWCLIYGDLVFVFCQLGVINCLESFLLCQVFYIFDIGVGIEVGVVVIKIFFGQLLVFYGLVMVFVVCCGVCFVVEIKVLVDELCGLFQQLCQLVDLYDQCFEVLVFCFVDIQDVIFLGWGINYLIVLEGVLKFKEISYIYVEGYLVGEMKYGLIVLLDLCVLVVLIVVFGMVFEKVFSNVQEVKVCDVQLIGVVFQGFDMDLFDELFLVFQVSEWISFLFIVVFMQLLSYYIVVYCGLDVD